MAEFLSPTNKTYFPWKFWNTHKKEKMISCLYVNLTENAGIFFQIKPVS